MKPLFSLHDTIACFAEPIDPAAVSIRPNEALGVLRAEDQEAKVLVLPEGTTLSDAGKSIQAAAAQYRASMDVITVDAKGHVTGIIESHRLLAAYMAIAANQDILLQTLLDTMSEAITIVDTDNIVQYWNPAAEKIYEIERSQVVGTRLDVHFASESIRLLDALKKGESVYRVYHIPRPDRHVLINAAPILQDDHIIGAISIEQDITELVRLNDELAHTTAHLHNLQQEMSRFHPADDPFFPIKGHSSQIQAAIQAARKVAQTDATVLIDGESGVGKELFAQAIHQASRRRDKPFIAINCGAIPAALFESELFGYQGGAFTGAEKKGKPGKLELAHGGTLFLDEIGELSLELQVKLLRALQERQFYRVGGTEPITVNTRIVSATNRHLEQMVKDGLFREDLYYRLNVFTLEIPPLRERREDIPELVQIFLHEYAIAHEHPVPRIAPEVMQALYDYHWPGNIRQLRNVIERLSILQEGGLIRYEQLPSAIRQQQEEAGPSSHPASTESRILTSHSFGLSAASSAHAEIEQEQIRAALERTYGNKKAAAALLGFSRGTLYNKMKKYGI
ncbi:sigma 54-interacting transcriptional regulator [Brevibacillus ruminantium]|uniref:Sigma 54-interacting transcriptional regulator n=1 Tax=Brevibacillus ruminantium TaxID=2950604 RepID=A0ABY4WDC1_9BACL|nr:sigma 54-interacting transcriptional regulator [Brevibacillus ruminantium]USG64846.1 sigma 54-interacting transcriptional regulator [Brevibacillus ruminantium]